MASVFRLLQPGAFNANCSHTHRHESLVCQQQVRGATQPKLRKIASSHLVQAPHKVDSERIKRQLQPIDGMCFGLSACKLLVSVSAVHAHLLLTHFLFLLLLVFNRRLLSAYRRLGGVCLPVNPVFSGPTSMSLSCLVLSCMIAVILLYYIAIVLVVGVVIGISINTLLLH